jgi:hypothetical protein
MFRFRTLRLEVDMNLKPFDLQKALAGDPVVTRGGHKVSQIVYLPGRINGPPVAAFSDSRCLCYRPLDGRTSEGYDTDYDLFMAPKTVTKYVNVYPHRCATLYATPEDAKMNQTPSAIAVAVPVTYEV